MVFVIALALAVLAIVLISKKFKKSTQLEQLETQDVLPLQVSGHVEPQEVSPVQAEPEKQSQTVQDSKTTAPTLKAPRKPRNQKPKN